MCLPEKQDLGAAVDAAMRLIETHNTELKDVLPKGYQRLRSQHSSSCYACSPHCPAGPNGQWHERLGGRRETDGKRHTS